MGAGEGAGAVWAEGAPGEVLEAGGALEGGAPGAPGAAEAWNGPADCANGDPVDGAMAAAGGGAAGKEGAGWVVPGWNGEEVGGVWGVKGEEVVPGAAVPGAVDEEGGAANGEGDPVAGAAKGLPVPVEAAGAVAGAAAGAANGEEEAGGWEAGGAGLEGCCPTKGEGPDGAEGAAAAGGAVKGEAGCGADAAGAVKGEGEEAVVGGAWPGVKGEAGAEAEAVPVDGWNGETFAGWAAEGWAEGVAFGKGLDGAGFAKGPTDSDEAGFVMAVFGGNGSDPGP